MHSYLGVIICEDSMRMWWTVNFNFFRVCVCYRHVMCIQSMNTVFKCLVYFFLSLNLYTDQLTPVVSLTIINIFNYSKKFLWPREQQFDIHLDGTYLRSCLFPNRFYNCIQWITKIYKLKIVKFQNFNRETCPTN